MPLGLTLMACSDGEGPMVPSTDPSAPAPVAMSTVSGNGQQGRIGELLGEPFVVRVTDAQGVGVGGVAVRWDVISGGRWGLDASGDPVTTLVRRTDPEGFAKGFFFPSAAGTSTVTASVPALQGSPVTFTADVNVLVISAGGFWGRGFLGPEGATEVTVPVGVTVEWVNVWGEHTVTSSSAPPGGSSFDSGSLDQGERFQFVPRVAGTWKYFCEVHGASEESGTITAR